MSELNLFSSIKKLRLISIKRIYFRKNSEINNNKEKKIIKKNFKNA